MGELVEGATNVGGDAKNCPVGGRQTEIGGGQFLGFNRRWNRMNADESLDLGYGVQDPVCREDALTRIAQITAKDCRLIVVR